MNADPKTATALPIFVVRPMPDAPPDAVHWTDICHGQRGRKFIFINHEASRNKSRWVPIDNKRPLIVYDRRWNKLGASSTLAGALKIAQRFALEMR